MDEKVVVLCQGHRRMLEKMHNQLFMGYDNDPMFIAEGQEEIEGGDEDDMDGTPFGSYNNEYMANLRDQVANSLSLNASN